MLGTCPCWAALSQLSGVPQPKGVFWVSTHNTAAEPALSSCKEPWTGCHIHPAPPGCRCFQVRAAGAIWEHGPHWRRNPDGVKRQLTRPWKGSPSSWQCPSTIHPPWEGCTGRHGCARAKQGSLRQGRMRAGDWHAGRCPLLVTRGRRRRLLRHCQARG